MRLRYGDLVFEGTRENAGGFYSICYLGAYDPLLAAIRPDDVVVDGGANMGVFSLLAARRARRVYAVEPHPGNFAQLEANVRRNHATNVVPVRAALADRSGTQSFGGSGETGQLGAEGPTVRVLTIPEVAPEPVQCLKLDVEGAEYLALQGMGPLDGLRAVGFELDRRAIARLNRSGIAPEPSSNSYERMMGELEAAGLPPVPIGSFGLRLWPHLTDRPAAPYLVGNEVASRFLGLRSLLDLRFRQHRDVLHIGDDPYCTMVFAFRPPVTAHPSPRPDVGGAA